MVAPTSTSWIPSSKIYNAFAKEDVRRDVYIVDEPLYKAAGKTFSVIVNKYAGTGYGTNNENVADLKVFRTAASVQKRERKRTPLQGPTVQNLT